MIIRSQDKKSILNFNNITDITIQVTKKEEYEIIACLPYSIMDDCGYSKIGTYSTEEKAIKVLDMIQNAYTQYGTIEDGWRNVHGAFNLPKCFQMPQDSEV